MSEKIRYLLYIQAGGRMRKTKHEVLVLRMAAKQRFALSLR